MATTPTSTPPPKTNRIGLAVMDYRGGKTTLCAGCGHNAISERIIDAMYEMGVKPERVAKLSGIGCSSKSPAYFMGRSHSFNAVHGRMPSVATGAVLANRSLMALGVSGDGDTASIGMGQFVHLMRRNLPIIYIIEDNGVYGLTKGQFSATADLGSKLKTGVINDLPPVDTCAMAITLGATFVGRSFSGDKRQLHAMLKAAIAHRGTVMLDVVSPCVTFNDHEGSTKSYKYMNHARWFTTATAQAGRRLRPHRPHQSHHPPQRSPRKRRGADRSVLRKSQSPQLCRFTKYYRAASGNVARVGGASGKGSAGTGDGRTEVDKQSIKKVSIEKQFSVASFQFSVHFLGPLLLCGSPLCSGFSPGSGKSVSADLISGSWSRCPSCPRNEVLPG